MAFEMVDGDQRLASGEREALAGEQSDHHPADQSWPRRRRDRIDVVNRHLRLGEDLLDQVRKDLDMRPGRDFGNDATVRLMRLRLPDHRLRQDLTVGSDQRRAGIVAGGFEAEDQ